MTEAQEKLYREALDKGLVVFAPKKTAKKLSEQYHDLGKHEAISALSGPEQKFLWFFRAAHSPFAQMPDKEKLGICIDISWDSEQVRTQKKEEWRSLKKFDPRMTAAMERMSSYNVEARVKRYQSALILLDNCLEIVAQPIAAMSDEQKDKYIVRAKKAQEAIDAITESLEVGAYGVTQTSDTILPSLMGILKDERTRVN
jgi:hypothetical protein